MTAANMGLTGIKISIMIGMGILCLLSGTMASGDAVRVYGVKGQNITLKPEVPNVPVESAQWILNDSVIAQWDQRVSESSHPSLLLNKNTFSLTIYFLQENYTGLYICTINNLETAVSYQLCLQVRLVIKKQCTSTTCNLRCTGADNETPLVSWTDNKGRKMSGPAWVVERSEHLDVNYNCSSSSGSWETISERELFGDYSVKDKTEHNLGIILGAVIGPTVVLIIIVVVYIKCKGCQDFLCDFLSGHTQPNGDAQEYGEFIEILSLHGDTEDQVPNPAVQVDTVCEDAS